MHVTTTTSRFTLLTPEGSATVGTRERRTRFAAALRTSFLPLLAPLAFTVLTGCGTNDRIDEGLRADLAAASVAPTVGGQYANPRELADGQGYPYPQQQGYAYPPPQGYAYPPPQTRVIYVPQQSSTVRRSGGTRGEAAVGTQNGSRDGVYSGGEGRQSDGRQGQRRQSEQRNTQKGAVIGAAAGAAIGVATARDKVKGGAIGALGGAVLGGVIGHQVKTPRN